MKVYLIGSLRNPEIARVASVLRANALEVFDDWRAPGPETDDHWQAYCKTRGLCFRKALEGHHARHVFAIDKQHLDDSQAALMVLPAGKSAHLELGYMVGRGRPAFILLDKEPERFDIMYNFATGVSSSLDEILSWLAKYR